MVEQDLGRQIISFLANQYWNNSEPFSQIWLGPDLPPDQALQLVSDEIEKTGVYEVDGEWIGMGNHYSMKISKVHSHGPDYNGLAYELKIAGGENHISMTARFTKLEQVFAPARIFQLLIEYASRSHQHWENENKIEVESNFPIGYYDDKDK